MTETLHFIVTGGDRIHRDGGQRRIGNALGWLPGVIQVEASAATQRVTVTVHPAQVNAERVQSKLIQIGFEVNPEMGTK